MSIPLVQEATKDAINTSIIAIKRNIERINMLLGLVDSGSPDLSGLATKQELQDAVTELQPVDEVTVGNMHSVTSNAVAECGIYSTEEVYTGKIWYDGKKIYRKCYYNLSISITNPNTWYDVMTYPTFIDTITDYITIANKRAFQNSLIHKLSNNLAILSSQSWDLNALVLEYTKV